MASPRSTAFHLILGLGILAVGAVSQAQDRERPPQEIEPAPARPGGNPLEGMPDFVAGLKATPGCLGVETAQTRSGKLVIFAWFENKRAVMRWYNGRMHQSVRDLMENPAPGRKPMADVPDDVPVLTIASITPSDKEPLEGVPMPVSQIAIELYTPLPGGLAVGGTFAPNELKVPGLVREGAGGSEPKSEDQP